MTVIPYASAQSDTSGGDRPGVEISARQEDPRLNDMAVATAVTDRQPDGAGDRFPAGTDKLMCWTSVQNLGEPTQVKHTWRHGDRVVSELTLSVGKSRRWRSWSQQRIPEKLTGTWSCEVTDAAGARLGMATVTVE
ncbi:DUF2914 domain-containing protein [Haliangium sp.]|uniref:DUF2914 domain-containing protein n=2 Tax=Haliangium sp. TaxID=2663208 RepID=UPI003D0EAAA3